jgi:non-ribosomal peptide synthetase component F
VQARLAEEGRLLAWHDAAEPALVFDSAAFDVQGMDATERQIGALAASTLADSNIELGRVSLLSDSERKRLIEDFNQTACEYPADLCVFQLVEQQAVKTPDAIALVFEGRELSYRELNERANQLAHKLSSLGVSADSLVGLCVDRTEQLVIGALAIQKAGGAYVPLDPSYPVDRLRFMAEDSEAKLIVSERKHAALFEGAHGLVLVDELAGEIQGLSRDNLGSDVGPHHLAYVIYTSGSPASPRA